jgi:hypothetical protein
MFSGWPLNSFNATCCRPHFALRTVAAAPSPMSDALMVRALSLFERVTSGRQQEQRENAKPPNERHTTVLSEAARVLQQRQRVSNAQKTTGEGKRQLHLQQAGMLA